MEFWRWFGRILVRLLKLRWLVTLLKSSFFWGIALGSIGVASMVIVPLLIWAKDGPSISIWWLIPAWILGSVSFAYSYWSVVVKED